MAAANGARSRVPAAALVAVVLVAGLAAGGSAAEVRRQKNVQVALRAKWAGTPLLLEASELLSKEWKDLFWDFIDHWKELDKASECLTAKCCVQKIVEDARSLLSEPLASIFEFSLTLRSASPRLVLYKQLAEESLSSVPVKYGTLEQISGHSTGENFHEAVKGTCCWVDTGSALLSNSADLRKWLDGLGKLAVDSTQQPELFDFDHIHPQSNITAPIAIFYGAFGTKCFKELHVHLAEASKQGKVRYALHQVLPSGCQATFSFCGSVGAVDAVTLSGYGVELALKNMEYKATDDTAIKKSNSPGHCICNRACTACPCFTLRNPNCNIFKLLITNIWHSLLKNADSTKHKLIHPLSRSKKNWKMIAAKYYAVIFISVFFGR